MDAAVDNNYLGTALIVEDDSLLALVEGRLLAKLGYKVVGKAKQAEEAIHLVRQLEPDFILMDISLKGEMDGVEAIQEVRKFSDIPVIYLSGTSDRVNYERARKTNFVDYLIKPVTLDDLRGPASKAVKKKMKRSGKSSGKKVPRAS